MAIECMDVLTVVEQFDTLEWSIQPEGGEKISLLGGNDPFKQETADRIAVAA